MPIPEPTELAQAVARTQPALDAVRHPGVRVLEIEGACLTIDPNDHAQFAWTNRNRAPIPGPSGR